MAKGELKHIGMPRRSGRFPWGSGKNPFQSSVSFMGAVKQMRQEGLSDTQIARGLGMSTTELRIQVRLAGEERRAALTAECIRMQEKGMSKKAIGERLGIPDTTVGNLLRRVESGRGKVTQNIADTLRESIKEHGCVDIGKGVAPTIGISDQRLDAAKAILLAEGYRIHHFQVKQQGTGHSTTIKALGGPYKDDAAYTAHRREIHADKSLIMPITGRSDDMGNTINGNVLKKGSEIPNVSLDRIHVRYGPDGGSDRDGVIELRRGVADLDLGKANYAQVRVAVNGTHYMKGMAMYSDNIPAGKDIVFNTNKSVERAPTPLKTMKGMKTKPDGTLQDNPFGASIDTQKGALNVIREEGQWSSWTRALSSQMLSKQSPALARQQLNLQYQLRKEEFEQIKSYTNPAVRKRLLASFAMACDKDAVHLQAAALPRQCNSIILPVPSLKSHEIYAPNFNNGEQVSLIRHPHGGTFEIPTLTVNNKNREARASMGTAPLDAVGINPETAQRLSGADFDGDHVIVIPNPQEGGQIRTSSALKGLQNFDHLESYRPFNGMRTIDGGVWNDSLGKAVYPTDPQGNPIRKTRNMGRAMGEISNLITDMTIKGASQDEIARAVRHSMVIVDAEKHSLNFRESAVQNGISSLRAKYQSGPRGGAETLISRAKARFPGDIPEIEPGQFIGHPHRVTGQPTKVLIDPNTGQELFRETGRTKRQRVQHPDGKVEWVETDEPVMTQVTRMREIQIRGGDAHELSSGTPMERVYADHANRMMAMGNEARRVMVNTPPAEQNKSAAVAYRDEVARLNAQYRLVLENKPRERAAQVMAESITNRQIQDNPGMRDEEIRRAGLQNLTAQRQKHGAERVQIHISDREWEAIQAGALSNSRLVEILSNADEGRIRELATPRERRATLSNSQANRARQMLAQGHTQAEVADALGVTTSILKEQLYGN